MQVVVVIGDIIGQCGHLRLGTGMGRQFQIVPGVIVGQRIRKLSGHRTIMFGNGLKGFPGEVQPVKLGIVPLQRGDNFHGLRIVIKSAMGLHEKIQRVLSGMTEWCVAKVMSQRHRFGQLSIQSQCTRDGPCYLRHFDRMCQPRAVIITFVFDEDLCFVLQPPKGTGMDNPVAVALEARAERAFPLLHEPSPGACGIRGKWRGHCR